MRISRLLLKGDVFIIKGIRWWESGLKFHMVGEVVSGATGSLLGPSRLSRKGKGTAVMLTGEYQHNMDLKGRVTVPSKFREDLGDTFYVRARALTDAFVLSRAQWDNLVEKVGSLPLAQGKAIQRFFFSGAAEVEPDSRGASSSPRTCGNTRGWKRMSR